MFNLQAPAKINLSLEIIGRRPDGFHDIESIVQAVSLFDVLTFVQVPGFHLECSQADLRESNLVEQAARLLAEAAGMSCDASITLEKYIPVGAGLGGGSSDAATTLLGLNRLWHLELDCSGLSKIATRLGSDVPFFLYQGTCLIEGRGERVKRVGKARPNWYLLMNPGFEISTGEVYEALQEAEWTDGSETRRLAEEMKSGERSRVGKNGLQEALFRISPPAREFFDRTREALGSQLLMSGSGPTVYATFESEEEANEAAERLKDFHCRIYVVVDFAPAPGDLPCA